MKHTTRDYVLSLAPLGYSTCEIARRARVTHERVRQLIYRLGLRDIWYTARYPKRRLP